MPVEDLGGKAFIENYDLGCRMPRFFTFVTVAVKGKTDVDSSFFWKRYVFFFGSFNKMTQAMLRKFESIFPVPNFDNFLVTTRILVTFFRFGGFQISHSFAIIPLQGDNPAWKNSNLVKTHKKKRSKVGDIFRNLAKSVTCDIS